jgi:excisionase family DNA binding protein
MVTVPEAARRLGRNPETIRRWIRAGKLPAEKIGTQHMIEESDLELPTEGTPEMLPLPEEWKYSPSGEPAPNWVALLHESRRGR